MLNLILFFPSRGPSKHPRIRSQTIRSRIPRHRLRPNRLSPLRILTFRKFIRVLRDEHWRKKSERQNVFGEALRRVCGMCVFIFLHFSCGSLCTNALTDSHLSTIFIHQKRTHHQRILNDLNSHPRSTNHPRPSRPPRNPPTRQRAHDAQHLHRHRRPSRPVRTVARNPFYQIQDT